MFDRLELLIGNKLSIIQKTKILIVGVGGVGGYALECLVRSGIKFITIIDYDTIEITNLNRQVVSNQNNIGKLKTESWLERCKEINPDINITCLNWKLDTKNINDLNWQDYTFILDCCDDILAKTALIIKAYKENIKIISSMGTAKRLHPELLEITTLGKTYNDALARILRKQLGKDYYKVPVIWSREVPKDIKKLGTICHLPMTAGALMASYVLNEIIKQED